MSRKIIAFLLIFCLVFEQSGFAQVASVADLSAAFASVSSFDKFRPMHLRSLSLDRGRNDFNLFVDKGDVRKFPPAEVKESADKLMEYFQIGITLPDSAFWVNLRPDGADTIIDPALEKTDVGKVLLEADLVLKKDMARATSPKTKEGRVYWNKLYVKAESLFGSREVSIPTLTRPWIVPGEIIVRQSPESAYVYKAGLVVKLEQDHLRDSRAYKFNDPRLQELNEYSTRLIRELILPQLTKKVNSSRSYAALRQVFYSLVLAKWFKEHFYGSRARYADRINTGDLSGLTSREAWSKDTYFQAYRTSFAEGEYTARESVSGAGGATMRSYASGGINGLMTEARPMIVSQRSGIVPGRGNLQFDGGRITVIGSQTGEAEQPRVEAVTVSSVKTDGGSMTDGSMRVLLRDLRGLAYRPLSQSRKEYDAALDARVERSLGDRESFEGFRSFVAAQAQKEGKLLNYGGAGFVVLLATAVLTAPFPPVQLAALISFAAWTAGFVFLGSRAADTNSILHRLNALSTSVIAVSIGGTKLGAAPVTWSGRILKPAEIKWQSRFKTVAKQAKPEAVVDVMLAQIEEVVRANRLPLSVVRTVGISFAGPVDPDAGIVGTPFAAPNLPFDHYDLKGVMEERLEKRYGRHISVEIENDCVAALKGELSPLGGLHNWRSGMVFIIGTGINGAAAIDGKPYAGAAGEITELGHSIVPVGLVSPQDLPSGYKGAFFYTGFITKGDHPKDSAGNDVKGDFDDLLCGPSLDAEFARYGLTLKGITAKAIQGDPFAVTLIRNTGIRIGTALAAFIWAYRNEPFVRHIVLVSGVAENLGKGLKATSGQDLFIAAVREGTVDELSRMGISGKEAKDIAAGIERSRLGYERELVAFTPIPSRDGGQAGELDRQVLRQKGEVLNNETQTLVQPTETVSRGVVALNRKKDKESEKDGGTTADPVGGIDMRGMKVLTQPALVAGGMAGPAVMVPLAQLDARWKDIRLEMARGATPYLKIKEYVAACGGREDAGKQLKEVATCVADILKADEEKAAETCAEMKEIIVQLG